MNKQNLQKTNLHISDWETIYRSDIEIIYKSILFFVKTKTTKSMHISKFQINEDDLYDQLVEHLYKTSNNTHKHYCK